MKTTIISILSFAVALLFFNFIRDRSLIIDISRPKKTAEYKVSFIGEIKGGNELLKNEVREELLSNDVAIDFYGETLNITIDSTFKGLLAREIDGANKSPDVYKGSLGNEQLTLYLKKTPFFHTINYDEIELHVSYQIRDDRYLTTRKKQEQPSQGYGGEIFHDRSGSFTIKLHRRK
ncbi:Uncharacterised protein [Sphingobacterium spiritivorum]|uniref:Uncharacterized protein n=1 Tax=Sphingobacterium spiritivorum TaxID=258 RepID=A0A380CCK3_SPHSI|nr:hypothetical protein [Sphingobacterium spiritivorum]SUJ16227.1 Uncharacterised protein [Sphingobacterium spiritivorum]